ncbi:hypothetical protein ACLK1S_23625 [Escherichia coli]
MPSSCRSRTKTFRSESRIAPRYHLISLPAVGQGAVGIECRLDDTRTRELLAALNHHETALRVTAERAMIPV